MVKVKVKYLGLEFAKAIRTKRLIEQDMDLRACAKEIGVSAATLNRVEKGSTPDLNTFAAICYWADLSMSNYITYTKTRKK